MTMTSLDNLELHNLGLGYTLRVINEKNIFII